jgi:hypothetical protein
VTIQKITKQATEHFDMILIEMDSVFWESTAGFVKVYLEPEDSENYVRFEIAMPNIRTRPEHKVAMGYELVAFW